MRLGLFEGRSHSRTVLSSLALIRVVSSVGDHLVTHTGCLWTCHVLSMTARVPPPTSNTCILPESSPATSTLPSARISPQWASLSKRPIVLRGSRLRIEKMSTRGPEVTAKRSLSLVAATSELDTAAPLAAGKLMCEMGHDAVDVWDFWFLNDLQYRCSAVTGLGPEGSLTCASGSTSAAIAAVVMRRGRCCGFSGRRTAPSSAGVANRCSKTFFFFFLDLASQPKPSPTPVLLSGSSYQAPTRIAGPSCHWLAGENNPASRVGPGPPALRRQQSRKDQRQTTSLRDRSRGPMRNTCLSFELVGTSLKGPGH
ncbi:hypothetical protein VTI74DRAFT_3030 [Chaetomium olivicolor]